MANIRNSNTIYLDTASTGTSAGTTGNFDLPNIKVDYIAIRATSANAVLILQDVTTGATKLNYSLQAADESDTIEFVHSPMVFPNGIAPTTMTNCVATLVVKETRG